MQWTAQQPVAGHATELPKKPQLHYMQMQQHPSSQPGRPELPVQAHGRGVEDPWLAGAPGAVAAIAATASPEAACAVAKGLPLLSANSCAHKHCGRDQEELQAAGRKYVGLGFPGELACESQLIRRWPDTHSTGGKMAL